MLPSWLDRTVALPEQADDERLKLHPEWLQFDGNDGGGGAVSLGFFWVGRARYLRRHVEVPASVPVPGQEECPE